MTLVDDAVWTVHLLFAAAWVGSVLFVTWGVLPPARDGDFRRAGTLSFVLGRLAWVSRASALVLLVTGGHMAATTYGVDCLTGTTAGHLVVGMVVLWAALAGLVEAGVARTRGGLAEDLLREPVRENLRLFRAASLVAVLLILDAGAIAAYGGAVGA